MFFPSLATCWKVLGFFKGAIERVSGRFCWGMRDSGRSIGALLGHLVSLAQIFFGDCVCMRIHIFGYFWRFVVDFCDYFLILFDGSRLTSKHFFCCFLVRLQAEGGNRSKRDRSQGEWRYGLHPCRCSNSPTSHGGLGSLEIDATSWWLLGKLRWKKCLKMSYTH